MTTLDLQRAPLHDLVGFDFLAPGRDLRADVETVQRRVDAFLDAVADSAWDRPISESAVAGAPAWTLRDHIGHVADWNDEAIRYIRPVLEGTGDWPRDEDYDADFDAWNEGRRPRYETHSAAELRAWHRTSADRLFDLVRQLPPDVAGSPGAWEWVWHNLTSHAIDHLAPASRAALADG
jgi:hypothetical protein